jgi:hypothetical protein
MFGECALTDPAEREPARGGEGGIRHAPGRDDYYNARSQALDSNQQVPVSRLISAARSSGVQAETVTPRPAGRLAPRPSR